MKFNFEKMPEKNAEESRGIAEYEKIYEIINNVEIVSAEENQNWSIEKLENQLSESFKLSGQEALKINNGIIYTTLSGGLDSTLALALLRNNFPDAKIVTLTMGGGENHPDIQYARLASEKFGAENIEIIPTQEEIQETIEEYKQKFPDRDIKDAVEKGDFDVYFLYKKISTLKPKSLIVHDGIDEEMGGYWNHRKESTLEEKKKIFSDYWKRLIPEHLDPLIKTAQSFGIKLFFPYLTEEVVKLISEIPVNDRAAERVGKKPLRKIGQKLGIPDEIINRTKRGQVGMMDIS